MLVKLIVCLTGMPGAGKSTIACGLAEQHDYQVINMGDAVRAEAKRRDIEPTRTNLGRLMLELRERDGPGAIVELIRDDIISSQSDVIIIDGIRSNDEVEALRKIGLVKLLAVHASTDIRFGFLKERGRSDDPQTKEHFTERDDRELRVGISTSIALSDDTISNTNSTKQDLISTAYSIIKGWMR